MKRRSDQKELLDLGPNYFSNEEYSHCQKKLFQINKLLGCFKDTIRLLDKYLYTSSVLDIGCGGGLMLLNLSKYFPDMRFYGIDISKEAIDMAHQNLNAWKKNYPNSHIAFDLQPQPVFKKYSADIVLSSFVLHHLSDNEIICFLKQLADSSAKIVILHDLHRHLIAYYFYKIISPLLFRNRLITHDGLISIRRGFKRNELKNYLDQARIAHYQITWRFPFRWRIIIWKN